MECCSKFWRLLIVLWSSSLAIHGQDCPELQIGDLGSTDTATSDGLLALTLVSLSSGQSPSVLVQILELNTVCLSQGALNETYTRTSVVVRYTADGVEATSQVEYQCTNGVWEIPSTGNPTIEDSPTATLTTPVRTDCILCSSSGPVTAAEHCSECNVDPACVGLMSCTGTFISQTCCNYFDMAGSCVTACPANSSPDGDFDCVCDTGYEYDDTDNSCIDINECSPNPCENGGTCTDLVNTYSCVCVPGYTDDNCTTIIECPCENGGTCGSGATACECPDGYTGDMCEVLCEIEDCTDCLEDNVCAMCEDGLSPNEDGTQCVTTDNNTPDIVGGVLGALAILLLLIGIVVGIIATVNYWDEKSCKNKVGQK